MQLKWVCVTHNKPNFLWTIMLGVDTCQHSMHHTTVMELKLWLLICYPKKVMYRLTAHKFLPFYFSSIPSPSPALMVEEKILPLRAGLGFNGKPDQVYQDGITAIELWNQCSVIFPFILQTRYTIFIYEFCLFLCARAHR